MGQNTIIELNGKRYDAISGTLVTESRIKATPEKRPSLQHHAASPSRRALDGIVKHTAATPAKPHSEPASPHLSPAKAAAVRRSLDVHWPVSKTVKPHKTERSKTLMRHVVKKPQVDMKPAIKTTSPSELQARRASEVAKQLERKLSASQVNPVRLSHATHTAKSHHVRHFETPRQPMAHSPAAHTIAAATPAPAVTAAPAADPAAPRQDVFEAALARATSHTQPAPKHTRSKSRMGRRLTSVLAGGLALLALAGFIGYLNMPMLELRVASVRAGFSAAMPSYQPTGYALADDGIESSDGKVALSFRSGDSNYKVTQVASDWNSQTLLDYYTDAYGAPEQTIQSQGRIIYLYDDSRATWVNGGVRYEISGSASLTSKELVSLATSM